MEKSKHRNSQITTISSFRDVRNLRKKIVEFRFVGKNRKKAFSTGNLPPIRYTIAVVIVSNNIIFRILQMFDVTHWNYDNYLLSNLSFTTGVKTFGRSIEPPEIETSTHSLTWSISS